MVIKRKIYILALVLTMFLAALAIALIVQEDSKAEYKGTLVETYHNEAVV